MPPIIDHLRLNTELAQGAAEDKLISITDQAKDEISGY